MDDLELAQIPTWVIHDAMNSVWGPSIDTSSERYKKLYKQFRNELLKRNKKLM